jgi:hypothetical protein
MSRLREKIESIVFAGLEPGQKAPQSAALPTSFTGRLRQRVDAWVLGGPGPSDPLYLTNRTTGQKIRSGIAVGLPLVILMGVVGFSLSSLMTPPKPQQAKELTPSEAAARLLPSLNDLKLETRSDIEVVELRIDRANGLRLAGILKNRTAREIASADLACDLTNAGGTQVGTIAVHVESIPASGRRKFETPIRQGDAAFVLVREIQTH